MYRIISATFHVYLKPVPLQNGHAEEYRNNTKDAGIGTLGRVHFSGVHMVQGLKGFQD